MSDSITFRSLLKRTRGLIAARGDATVSGIASDSRLVRPGYLFVAYRGFEVDGHDFIESALVNGAVAVVLDDPRHEATVEGVPWARVEDARVACAELAAEFFGNPSEELRVAGVTGTNGKTTTTFLIEAALAAAGMRAAVIGTLGYGASDDLTEAPRTTPDAVELQRTLREMADSGTDGVAVEISSHSLVLHRPWRCSFDVGVFTNLSQDHLDFHRSIEDYLEAKLLLFTEYARASKKPMVGAVNLDDPFGGRIAERAECPVLGYGLGPACDVRAEEAQIGSDGSRFVLRTPGGSAEVALSLPGHFNVHNALAAASAAHVMGVETGAIAEGLSAMPAVPGRFERVDAGQPFTIIVDYAHTPDALENVLRAARELAPRRLICVFGCGGDRDPDKRPKMGRAAAELADFTVVTSDNPRSEDPLAIIDAIVAGVVGEHYAVEPDRRAAIAMAVEMAEPGDLVMIAGKGHETYQIFADRTIDFDDTKVARELVQEATG
ncbi:MAG: UDP-N-acetylmuramoyl-L-alanyl-D-glutamate--2,6-diaminopimelate ligase [candidate division WS1 bacterium]|jgi:UDP-N-acetylmuramoyl-L-alanyl-D-glutamate--2,6-diaminopimelate ligase|nr:UDP-N-acetylmuramoyl-L-alanyl-D-glutamate--2,6-diaminopimelate ligase [candidate division WS1 bacterium]